MANASSSSASMITNEHSTEGRELGQTWVSDLPWFSPVLLFAEVIREFSGTLPCPCWPHLRSCSSDVGMAGLSAGTPSSGAGGSGPPMPLLG